MNKHDEIGLIGWGLKLGQQVFFHSSNLDIDDPIVQITLEDIRGIINFSQPNLKFFSLEFNNAYKIYTIYRTIFDWVNRDGAYYAMSVFVPHQLDTHPKEVVRLLNELLDRYHTNYIDVLSNQIKRIKEDPTLFFNVIKTFDFFDKEGIDSPITSDVQNMRYAYISYNSEDELSSFFDEPYREEYSQFKEVYFIDSKLEQESRLRVSPKLAKLSIPSILPRYTINLFIYEKIKGERKELNNVIPNIKVNGLPQFASTKLNKLKENDSIQVIIKKDGYEEVDLHLVVSKLAINFNTREINYDIELNRKRIETKLTVQTKDKNPIPIAEVELSILINEDSKKTGFTDLNGQFCLFMDADDMVFLDLKKDGYVQQNNVRWYFTPPKYSSVVQLEKDKTKVSKEINKKSNNKQKNNTNDLVEDLIDEIKPNILNEISGFIIKLNRGVIISALFLSILALFFIIWVTNTDELGSNTHKNVINKNDVLVDAAIIKKEKEIALVLNTLRKDSLLLSLNTIDDNLFSKLQDRYDDGSLGDSIKDLKEEYLVSRIYDLNKEKIDAYKRFKDEKEQIQLKRLDDIISNATKYAQGADDVFKSNIDASKVLNDYKKNITSQDQFLISRLTSLINFSRKMYNYKNVKPNSDLLTKLREYYRMPNGTTEELQNEICEEIRIMLDDRPNLNQPQIDALENWLRNNCF